MARAECAREFLPQGCTHSDIGYTQRPEAVEGDHKVKRLKSSPLDRGIKGLDAATAKGRVRNLTAAPLARSGPEDRKVRALVFNVPELSTKTVKAYVRRYTGLKEDEYRIKRIRQPNGERRFDILSMAGTDLRIARWARLGKALKARIRYDKPKALREQPLRKGKEIRIKGGSAISAMTYNLNGFWNKRSELFLLLEKAAPTIVAVQETRRMAGSRSWVPRYQVIEQFGRGVGKRGVLLGVRRDSGWTLSELHKNDYFIIGSLEGTSSSGARIRIAAACVYIPCRVEEKRKEAKESFRAAIQRIVRKGYENLILMGVQYETRAG